MPRVTCISCKHSARPKPEAKGDSHMMRAGFASCQHKDEPGVWLSVLFPRVCDRHSPSKDEDKRREWLRKWMPNV